MKNIGSVLKEKRTEMGISIEEAGEDLKIDSVLLDNLEDGNDKVFKDILEVKEIIKNYSKYLGIDYNLLLEEYNDYLFEKTSKISLADIKDGLEKTVVPEKREINSPYTIANSSKKNNKDLIIISILLVLVLVILFLILKRFIIG